MVFVVSHYDNNALRHYLDTYVFDTWSVDMPSSNIFFCCGNCTLYVVKTGLGNTHVWSISLLLFPSLTWSYRESILSSRLKWLTVIFISLALRQIYANMHCVDRNMSYKTICGDLKNVPLYHLNSLGAYSVALPIGAHNWL